MSEEAVDDFSALLGSFKSSSNLERRATREQRASIPKVDRRRKAPERRRDVQLAVGITAGAMDLLKRLKAKQKRSYADIIEALLAAAAKEEGLK